MTKIADDYTAIAKAQKALHPAPDGLRAAGDAKPEPKMDIMEPLFVDLCKLWFQPPGPQFVPHDPVVPPCDSGE